MSDSRPDEDGRLSTKGVDGQVEDCLALAARLGWGVGPRETHVIVENDTSAYRRRWMRVPGSDEKQLRTARPEYRRGLKLLSTGQADGVVALDLDRIARDPRDLEDLVDVVVARKLPTVSVTGSLDLSTGDGITLARMMCAVAAKSSMDTSRRVRGDRRKAAVAGLFMGGRRQYGFEPDGVTWRLAEMRELGRMGQAVLAGVSLRQVAADLRNRGVPSYSGSPWTPVMVRRLLLRPRLASLSVYRPSDSPKHGSPVFTDDEIVGVLAGVVPVFTIAEWKALRAKLTDPRRRTNKGKAPKWLLTGIGLCGVCGRTVSPAGGGGTRPYQSYQCRDLGGGRHVRRNAEAVDDLVSKIIVAKLRRRDAVGLLPEPGKGGVDLAAMNRDAMGLRERLKRLARLYADEDITGEQLQEGSVRLKERLLAVEGQIQAHAAVSPLAPIAGRRDALTVWRGLSLGRKRAIVRELVDVIIMPVTREGFPYRFDPRDIWIEWKPASPSKSADPSNLPERAS